MKYIFLYQNFVFYFHTFDEQDFVICSSSFLMYLCSSVETVTIKELPDTQFETPFEKLIINSII